MKKIKKSTKVKMVANVHKLFVWIFMFITYWAFIDFANRCKIESDQMYFALCGIFFIFDCFGVLLYWLLFGEEINKRIMFVYKLRRQEEREEIMKARQKKQDAIIEKRNTIMNKRFNDWYKDDIDMINKKKEDVK